MVATLVCLSAQKRAVDYSGSYNVNYGCTNGACVVSGTAQVSHVGQTVEIEADVSLKGGLRTTLKFVSSSDPVVINFNGEQLTATTDGSLVNIIQNGNTVLSATCYSGPCTSSASILASSFFLLFSFFALFLF